MKDNIEIKKNTAVQNSIDSKDDSIEIDFVEFLIQLLKHWWIILLVTVVFAVTSFAYFYSQYTPKYQASVKMYVNNESLSFSGSKLSISNADISAAQSLVNTYCEILKTRLTLNEVANVIREKYGYSFTSYQLNSMISAGAVNDTEIFYITITDSKPQRAINIANVIVDVLPNQIATVIDGASVRTVDRAEDALYVSAGFKSKVLLGAVVGAIVAAAFIFFRYIIFNDKVEESDWLRKKYAQIPILAEIPDADVHGRTGKYYRSYYYRSHYYSSYGKQKTNERK